jgi:hypothetical protein
LFGKSRYRLLGDHHPPAQRFERLADEFLGRERSVDLRGVKNVTPRSTAAQIREVACCLSIGSP